MSVNLDGTFLTPRAAMRAIKDGGRPIVATASAAALVTGACLVSDGGHTP